ncbi:hybrid sensor histidine kinase/response regulator [Chlorobium ferrooxidans]|uniref:histidine kinase n=1 Tax=Chlorobium ferrooxidans DSM 13031 TaxID=377431 RepID=Q0YRP3_9CHLB|nr:PAS domain S-box protein [Chlorobium ferrooxidans]EAT58970.1 PAS:Response regulator receiver:ATP-binding region, ATPase-like:Histidine kinase A-like [Chlorobium ferrooxidans DSM 13031]
MQNSTHKGEEKERNAQQRESTLNAVFDAVDEPAFIMDREGTILDANQAFARVYHKEVPACININAYDFFPPELAATRRIKAEEVFCTGRRMIYEDEQEGHCYRNTLYPIAGLDGRTSQLYIVAQDITDLKRAERDAETTQTLFGALKEAVPGAFYMLDAEWHYAAWNAYQRDVVVGRPDAAMASFTAIDAIHPDDRSKVGEKMANIMKSGVEESDVVRVLIQGGPRFRWFQLSGKRVFIKEKPFLIGVGTDVTEHKMKEDEALHNSEERLRKLFDEHSAVKLVLDPLTGNIIDANHAAAAFYGWSIDELCRKHIREVDTHPEEELKHLLEQDRVSEKNQFPFQHRRADGSLRDVEVFSSNINVGGRELLYAIVHDVTERRAAERELQKLSVAMQQSHAIVVITDLKGDIEYVNPAFTIASGYSQEEVIGKNPRILQSGTMQQSVYEELWGTILAGGVWKGEMYNRRKNGEFYWESAVISPVLNEEGVITNFVAIKEDITEKKKLWSELIAAKEHAEESDRLKTAFLANISHEIRTPMNGIVGLSEILKDPDLSKEEQSLYIDLIDQSCQRLLYLINDIIDISRIEAGKTNVKISRTPVNTTLRDLHAFFKPLAEQKGLRLSCTTGLSDSESVIETDSTKLTQILTNLLQNALKFTREGHIDFGYARNKNTLEFYVADSGIGISPDMQTKIFERFRQADNSLTRNYEGAGLGLSISQAYIEMLGGLISVKSTEGKGSEFIFTLPYNPAGFVETDVQPAAVKPNHDSLPGMTILIAEDDAVSSILLEKTLQAESITIISAGNGLDAVELVKEHPEIRLVLMDIKMPVMNGFDATRLIKQLRPGLPVIMQSAFTSESERGKAEDAGCNSFITKPVNKARLLELIHAALNRQPDKQ